MRYCNKYIYGFSTLSVFYKMYSRAKLYSKHERICSLRADFILSKRFFAEKKIASRITWTHKFLLKSRNFVRRIFL